jgi:hypothetical protein
VKQVNELLTDAEIREALEDPASPYFLEGWQARTALKVQAEFGFTLERAVAGSFAHQHEMRAEGRFPLAGRVAEGRWAR